MGKPLWKFLDDGGMSAAIEYGEIKRIKANANCCSWALGDLLHYYIIGESIFPGRYNTFNNNKLDNDDHIYGNCVSFDFMAKYFTRNMMNIGAQFLGNGNNIPATDNDHYIVAAFHSAKKFEHRDAVEFHFVRRHSDGKWSHRIAHNERVSDYFENINIVPNTIYDFTKQTSSYEVEPRRFIGRPTYEIFKGWYAIPNTGIQCGLDAAVADIYKSISTADWKSLPQTMQKDIEDLYYFCKRKNSILNKVETLEKLEFDYNDLADSVRNIPVIYANKFDDILLKYNQNRFADIEHSPSRDLRVGR